MIVPKKDTIAEKLSPGISRLPWACKKKKNKFDVNVMFVFLLWGRLFQLFLVLYVLKGYFFCFAFLFSP